MGERAIENAEKQGIWMDFLKMGDISAAEMQAILWESLKLKQEWKAGKGEMLLSGKTLLMLFSKNSTRTRVSFEAGIAQLGGHAIFLDLAKSQNGRGEGFFDTGGSVGGMADLVMARLHSHTDLEELARGSAAPVINGLTDLEHPCQAISDMLTLLELGKLKKGNKIAFVGDCKNNVANSLMVACAMCGLDVSLVGPKEFGPRGEYVQMAEGLGVQVTANKDAKEGLAGADAVYTDTWVSMGSEGEAGERLEKFAPYQVNSEMMGLAKEDAVFMHCLPAHRGQEVTDEVIDGKQSVVFQQAENRLHAQKGLMVWLLGAV